MARVRNGVNDLRLAWGFVVVAFGIFLAFALGLIVGEVEVVEKEVPVVREGPHWDCAEEDVVVVIDHTCKHIDEVKPSGTNP